MSALPTHPPIRQPRSPADGAPGSPTASPQSIVGPGASSSRMPAARSGARGTAPGRLPDLSSAGRPLDLATLALRTRAATSHAGIVARGTELLSACLQRELPLDQPAEGVTQAVQQHEEQAAVLGELHGLVVRLAAYPEILDVLAALERGATVIIGPDVQDAPAPLIATAVTAPARAVVVGDLHHATPQPARPWSRVLDVIRGGHRKSSSPAHLCTSSVVNEDHHGRLGRCAKNRGRLA